jgi:hypothetical protein
MPMLLNDERPRGEVQDAVEPRHPSPLRPPRAAAHPRAPRLAAATDGGREHARALRGRGNGGERHVSLLARR